MDRHLQSLHEALVWIGKPAIFGLIEALGDEKENVAILAARVLTKITRAGTQSQGRFQDRRVEMQGVIPALQAIKNDTSEHRRVRQAAVEAMNKILAMQNEGVDAKGGDGR